MKLSIKNLGRLGFTGNVNNSVHDNTKFAAEINAALEQYINGNWGDLPDEDKQANDNALIENDGRIVARYHTCIDDIYIITYLVPDPDRYTIIMFCNEY